MTHAMKIGLVSIAALALAGCAGTPQNAQPLESARAAYQAAAANAAVQARAPVELEVAERALGDAERFEKANADPAMVAHFAYLAEQRSRIATKMAELRNAEALVATSLKGGLTARDTERGRIFTLQVDSFFEGSSATLTPEGRSSLASLAQVLKAQPPRGIAVESYSDGTAPQEEDRRLGEARAEAVKQALVANGIEPSHVFTRAYGPEFGGQRRLEVVVAPTASASSGRTR